MPSTQFKSETGVIEIQRDDRWLNGYNKWFAIMTHANHDCQFLLTKDHAISIIYYIFKYISKPEAVLHTKLAISAAVRDAMQNSAISYMSDVNITKRFLIKTYNKLDIQREVGVPEAISHLLNIPDHYTEAVFEQLYTSHLLRYIKQFSQDKIPDGPESDADTDDMLDVQLISNDRKYGVVSSFDDYAHRGPSLADFYLYDYCSIVYKRKGKGGIRFTIEHPQHKSHFQFIRQGSYAVPNLLGRLLFVSQNSQDLSKGEDYYWIVSFLFMPWSYYHLHRVQD